MSEVDQAVDAVEISIEEARHLIELSKALHRLEKNKDFKLLILDGLLRKDAINQVQLLAAPGLKAPGEGPAVAKAGVLARIDMIGELWNFFRWTHLQAAQAEKDLAAHEETRGELLAQQLEE